MDLHFGNCSFLLARRALSRYAQTQSPRGGVGLSCLQRFALALHAGCFPKAEGDFQLAPRRARPRDHGMKAQS
jgi:hypothetical protein